MSNKNLYIRRSGIIEKMISGMTLEEKVSQLVHDAAAVPRMGLPSYCWWGEALHGLGRNGKATVFPQAIGMAATFDPALVRKEADVISTQARAKYNQASKVDRQGMRYRGLTFWSPNVNIFRDPRWGRGQETYGEDPCLAARMGVEFVRGLQGADSDYMKAAACAKHYAVHSGPESKRLFFNAKPPAKDFRETYLPAFKALVDAGVESVMGAYNRTFDVPCCGSKQLLMDILRNEWGFKGHVVSDCGAIDIIHDQHKYCETPAQSTALALNAGCDLNCGTTYKHAIDAVKQGLVSEETINSSLRRLLWTRAKLGMFDPESENKWRKLGAKDLDTAADRALARKAALESIVMVKNDKNLLPLKQKKLRRINVIGPNSASLRALLGNYYGISDRLVTALEGIVGKIGDTDTQVSYSLCCEVASKPQNFDWGVGDTQGSDVAIACLGLDGTMEGEQGDALNTTEQGDRTEIELPEHQKQILMDLRRTMPHIPVVAVIFGGSPVVFPPELADAILYAWYPGEEGGNAIADVLFGDAAPSGHLPLTFPKSTEDLPPFEDYAMKGRTYRYATKEPLYPFGFGLTYTRFQFGKPKVGEAKIARDGKVKFSVTLKNAGKAGGTAVVQVYVAKARPGKDDPVCSLREFRRVKLAAGKSATVEFELKAAAFESFDMNGRASVAPGEYVVTVADCAPVKCANAGGRTPAVSFGVTIAE